MHAAEEFSRGAAAWADRLVDTARDLLATTDVDESLLLRVEASLRGIDAGFATADLPADLAQARASLVELRTRGLAA